MQSQSTAQYPLPIYSKPTVHRVGSAHHGDREDNRIELYSMKDVWCLHLYPYHGSLTINGIRYRVTPASASITPPWAELKYEFQSSCYHISAFFTFPESGEKVIDVPVMHYIEEGFDILWRQMQEALEMFPISPRRSDVRVWDILWSVVDRFDPMRGSNSKIPLRVRETAQYIESNLQKPLRVSSIAERSNMTPTHLTRLFRESFDMTVVGYIRWRRMIKARDLLLHTDMPIKRIAQDVGLPDIQHFYKTFKLEFDQTPGDARSGQDCIGSAFSSKSDQQPSAVSALG